MRFRLSSLSLLALLLVGAVPSWTVAETIFSFQGISSNKAADVATGEEQLFVGVSDAGSNQVAFRFFNTGPKASSITAMYFDDGSLLGIANVVSGTGTSFAQGATPPVLPSGANINFQTTSGFLADSNPPVQPNGINPGEEATIVFNLISGQTFADTLAALQKGLELGSASNNANAPINLRIGIMVQGFEGGGSEQFVNGPIVPLPPAVLAGMALMGAIGVRRLTNRRRSEQV